MAEIQFVGGWVKDKKDKRDFPATRLLVREVSLPESFIVNPNTIIYNQGGDPSCVGFSAAGVKTDEEYTQYGKQIKFDGLRLYNECKKIDGIPNLPGTYPRVACKILNQVGCWVVPTSTTCPIRFLKPKPPEPTPEDIAKWKIAAYYRIDYKSTLDFVKQIICQFGSILTASTWFKNWMDKFWVFPEPAGGTEGGHSFKSAGWDSDSVSHKSISFSAKSTIILKHDNAAIVIVNSWGQIPWGVNGVSLMPYQMFLDRVLAEGDCWKLCDSKG
ncbi:MAG: hypothetical protein MUP81_00130 [Dehalococcoidia bacterium]|nr:hypothetical protein [Dehalococcoidia bacterium]